MISRRIRGTSSGSSFSSLSSPKKSPRSSPTDEEEYTIDLFSSSNTSLLLELEEEEEEEGVQHEQPQTQGGAFWTDIQDEMGNGSIRVLSEDEGHNSFVELDIEKLTKEVMESKEKPKHRHKSTTNERSRGDQLIRSPARQASDPEVLRSMMKPRRSAPRRTKSLIIDNRADAPRLRDPPRRGRRNSQQGPQQVRIKETTSTTGKCDDKPDKPTRALPPRTRSCRNLLSRTASTRSLYARGVETRG